jgi:CRISPR-associated protein Csx17
MLWNALFGEATEGLTMVKVGQYNPGRSGGFNQGPGIENKDFPANPWSFVLTVEGTIVWTSNVARRQGADRGSLRSPFTVRTSPVGYLSSSGKDDQKARAEIWTPLWKNPSRYLEVRTFLSEGRADVGRKTASTGIEFAEAASSLGVDRGVSEFVRYSLLKRRGDSFVALPAGRFSVQERSESDLVRELDPILKRIDRFLRDFKKEPPTQFASARRHIDEAIFNLLVHGGPNHVKSLLSAIGRMEQLIAQRDLSKTPKLNAPLYGLSPRWLTAADDGSLEVRLAASLASIGGTDGVGPIRANLENVDPEKPWIWAKSKVQFAWRGNSLTMKMASALEKRMMDAQRLKCRFNPIYGDIPLVVEDIQAFIEGYVDEKQVEDLLFGLTWIRWDDRQGVHDAKTKLMDRWAIPATSRIISRSWSLLKLLFLPGLAEMSEVDEVRIRPEPSILPLLLAGRTGEACNVAQRRLYEAGLAPIRSRFPEDDNGARIAAALLLPLRNHKKIANLVLQEREQNA